MRPLRSLGAVLLFLTCVAVVQPPAVAQTASGGTEAFGHLSACIGDSKRLLVLFLIDESGSLRETDPAGQRVAAARVALSGLESLARSSKVEVDVQLAGFSADYTPVGGWVALSGSTLGELQRSVGTFAGRDRGLDTDYFVALRGANRQLAQQEAGLSGKSCKAVLWFTDGKYDIEDRTTAARQRQGVTKDYAPDIRLDRPGGGDKLLAEGRRQLCESSPLVDELRQADVSLFAIALSTQIAAGDLAFLRAITNGTDGTISCGQRGSPLTGATLDASEIDSLISAFDRAANEIGGGIRDPGAGETPVCPTNPCAEGRRTFDLDDSLQRFHLLAATGREGIHVFLEGPGNQGAPLRLEPNKSGNAKVGEVPVAWNWATPTAVTVDASYPASGQGWDGKWTVTFVDPTGRPGATARSQIYLFGDLVPRLIAPEQFEAGKSNRLRIDVVSKLAEATPRRIASGDLKVSVNDPASNQETLLVTSALGPDGVFTTDYAPPPDIAAGEVVVKLELTVRTRGGLALAPASRSEKVPVFIAGLPSISLLRDRLPAIENNGSTTATVVVAADKSSGGCVWLSGSKAEGPASAGDVAAEASPNATGRDSCFRVEAGETGRFDVKIDAAGTANGKVNGNLRFGVFSDNKPVTVERTLAYEFPITRPTDPVKQWAVFLALLIPGILLPLLIAYAANWWSARFQPVGVVSSGLVPVRVGPSRVERLDAEGNPVGPLVLHADDFKTAVAPSARRRRRFSHGDYHFRVRLPKTPFAAPYGEGNRPGAMTGGSATRFASTSRDGHAGRLGRLALPGEWLLSSEAPRGAANGDSALSGPMQLLVFAGSALGPDDLRTVTNSIRDNAPAVAQALADRAPEPEPDGKPPKPGPGNWPPDEPAPGDESPPMAKAGTATEEPPPW